MCRDIMKVEDVMSIKPVSIDRNEFITRAREIMREYGYQSLPVTDSSGKVEGMITLQDVINVTSTRSNVTVNGYVRGLPMIKPDTDIAAAAGILIGTEEGRVPVVDENLRLIGLLSITDIFEGIGELGLKDVPVSDMMTVKVKYCAPEDNVSKVWLNMLEFNLTGFPVLKKYGDVVGMITRNDIVRRGYARIERESERGDMSSTTVQKIMSTPPITVIESDPIKKAAMIFIDRKIGRVPVLKEDSLAGIIDRYDVIRACRRTIEVDQGRI
jgi:CBS domain-containing protein